MPTVRWALSCQQMVEPLGERGIPPWMGSLS